jgi:hypothetical protein
LKPTHKGPANEQKAFFSPPRIPGKAKISFDYHIQSSAGNILDVYIGWTLSATPLASDSMPRGGK